MEAISWVWYNGSHTIAAKPIKTLELHYTMIQFLIILISTRDTRISQWEESEAYHLGDMHLEESKLNFTRIKH